MRAVRVLSLLVLAIVAGCTSADLEGTCWSLGPAECFLRPGCEYCNFFGRKNVCIWDAVAEYIPTSIANCTVTPGPKKPDHACDAYAEQEPCNGAQGCVWCISAAVKPACYPQDEAKLLPPAVFQCDAPSLLESLVSRHRRDII